MADDRPVICDACGDRTSTSRASYVGTKDGDTPRVACCRLCVRTLRERPSGYSQHKPERDVSATARPRGNHRQTGAARGPDRRAKSRNRGSHRSRGAAPPAPPAERDSRGPPNRWTKPSREVIPAFAAVNVVLIVSLAVRGLTASGDGSVAEGPEGAQGPKSEGLGSLLGGPLSQQRWSPPSATSVDPGGSGEPLYPPEGLISSMQGPVGDSASWREGSMLLSALEDQATLPEDRGARQEGSTSPSRGSTSPSGASTPTPRRDFMAFPTERGSAPGTSSPSTTASPTGSPTSSPGEATSTPADPTSPPQNTTSPPDSPTPSPSDSTPSDSPSPSTGEEPSSSPSGDWGGRPERSQSASPPGGAWDSDESSPTDSDSADGDSAEDRPPASAEPDRESRQDRDDRDHDDGDDHDDGEDGEGREDREDRED